MGSPPSLRQWVDALLPETTPCGRAAACELVRALLLGFTTQLGQLARQAHRPTRARGTRQFFSRWLNRDAWEPAAIYTQLHRLTRRVLSGQRQVLLLIDTTDLDGQWVVLQVSVPWQRRALPLFRVVYPYRGPERDQVSALAKALAWLEANLPGSRARYVLVMDRGFPSNRLVTELQTRGWRFVLRVKSNWRMEHRSYTGQMRYAVERRLGRLPSRLHRNVLLGAATHAPAQRSRANVVQFWGEGHLEPWFLVTSEGSGAKVVAIYRERMRIEQEFRDLKGPLGLDQLAAWQDRDRVARFLAWVAVYEWRLADLWLVHQLQEFAEQMRIKGQLSWIRTVREWIAGQLRSAAGPALARL
jgi:hypothetical protein